MLLFFFHFFIFKGWWQGERERGRIDRRQNWVSFNNFSKFQIWMCCDFSSTKWTCIWGRLKKNEIKYLKKIKNLNNPSRIIRVVVPFSTLPGRFFNRAVTFSTENMTTLQTGYFCIFWLTIEVIIAHSAFYSKSFSFLFPDIYFTLCSFNVNVQRFDFTTRVENDLNVSTPLCTFALKGVFLLAN